ncbi:MAG: hypothetical protein IJI24_05315, partial [Lachnospiraceae bacterium]|nr:hypothetical protein [Lachnospiraceae bacterium]
MKQSMKKRVIAAVAAASVVLCAAVPAMAEEAPAAGGTIMWLSNLTSGVQYDSTVNYLGAICEELGYNFTVVYGDGFNDAAGNLQAVKNGMTKDVVGIIASQDGGLLSIMEEYPDLYVAGYNTDMNSVFGGGENAAVLENDHFLGTIADGYIDGADTAKSYFETCMEKGFHKVAIVNFPGFAYPNLEVAANAFKEMAATYNETAADEDKIEIVGDVTTLMFSPIEDSWFLDGDNGNADAIVGFCAGTLFIYPQLVSAIGNGIAQPNMKLITSGYESDPSITDAIGDSEGKVIASVSVSPSENPAYALVLLDNAITGNQFDDFTVERI